MKRDNTEELQIQDFIAEFVLKPADFDTLEMVKQNLQGDINETTDFFVKYFDLGDLFYDLIIDNDINLEDLIDEELVNRDREHKEWLKEEMERNEAWRS